MSENGAKPDGKLANQTSSGNVGGNTDDLSDGKAPVAHITTGNGDDTVLKFKILEERIYLSFKVAVFLSALGLAACFLTVGLQVSKDSLTHIVHHQTTIGTSSHVKKVKAEKSKDGEKQAVIKQSMGNKALYSGSVITLVAFILGTGLTLLLTLMKFTFSSRDPAQEEQNIALAGPASELMAAIASYVRSKLK